ncbi:VOC family protein [Nitrospira lenta]|uniref:Glyoxalase family protein n=1 Tax=Nitrospira lenta TaxID=1436998 RepID=A0A330L3V3_9BACT|nr:VOC family protein [Nitrospira lenta]SPP64377.1 Glyoxalase family protein [Nitrospira lenta]
MIKRIAFTVYPVTDMPRARRFYEEILGLRMARRESHEFEWVEYDLDGGTFALTNLKEGGAPSADAGGSIAFEVQNVDDTIEQLRAKGVRVKLEPLSTPVCRLAVILDSEGNALTLHQVTQPW